MYLLSSKDTELPYIKKSFRTNSNILTLLHYKNSIIYGKENLCHAANNESWIYKLYWQFGTGYTKSRACIYVLFELVILFNILINEKQPKTRQHKAQIYGFLLSTRCSDWLTADEPSGKHHAADSNCWITAGLHWFLRQSQGACSLLTLHLHCKQHKERTKTHSLASTWWTPNIPQPLSAVTKTSWDFL